MENPARAPDQYRAGNRGHGVMMANSVPYHLQRDALLADPSVRDWVKTLIRQLEMRDPCDAVKDLDLLSSLFNQRLQDLFDSYASNQVFERR